MQSLSNTNNGTKLIAYYGRVSTSNQEDQKTIQNQEMELNNLANELYGAGNYLVVRRYYDEGWSGDILERPQLDLLRQDAKANMWDAVLIYDPDRLARQYHMQRIVQDDLQKAGKELRFRTRSEPRNDMEKVLYGVQGIFAEYERLKIRERFRIGKLSKASNKHIITSVAPYGYRLITRRGKPTDPDFVETHLVIDPVEARVVRMLFEWVGNQGLTLRKVVRRLKEMGVKPRKNKNGVWSTNTLSTMLRRETYIGVAYFNASVAVEARNPWKKGIKYRKVKKTSRKMKPKKEWIQIPVPAILDDEESRALFQRTRLQLKKNYEDSKRNKVNNYLLAERMRCSCGCSRTGEGPQKGKYQYYRCSNRVKNFPLPPTCKEKGINSRIADGEVWSKIVELMASKEQLKNQLERWSQRQGQKLVVSNSDIDTLKREIATLKKQEQRYQVAYGQGALELAQLMELTAPLKQKIGELERQVANEQAVSPPENDNSILQTEEVDYLDTEVISALHGLSFEQKRDIVLDVVDEIVGVPGRLEVSGYLPVAVVSPIQREFLFPSSTNPYVELKTSDRDRGTPKRRQVDAF
ncbi:MAG TPA: recombinase family protein [Candidatus Paceibacterota bacterium]|nr:recombinase family protein [Candidatus Paceibacterota bacterium]